MVKIAGSLSSEGTPDSLASASTYLKLGRYILKRGLMILGTIVLGVYLTIVVSNRAGEIDRIMQDQVERQLREMRYQAFRDDLSSEEVDALTADARVRLEDEYGLNLPDGQRNLLWTYKALVMDWGKVLYMTVRARWGDYKDQYDVVEIVLQHLPNTILLIGVADLMIFTFGIPLALLIGSQKRGQWLDRLVSILAPLSSIPSWVHGVFLIMIFAVQLRLFPPGGKYDVLPSETLLGTVPIVAKHMVLPVLAILLSMFFQLTYSWRTFVLIYSEEDYVELAIAKGLPLNTVLRNYILKPTMPYILTSFALTLVGFWQMTTALEYFFNWPGIGQLYVLSLPNFLGNAFFPGEMGVVLSIVVLFAYLLGFTVFALDIAYAWLDPRVIVGVDGRSVRSTRRTTPWRLRFFRRRSQPTAPLTKPAGKPSRPQKALRFPQINFHFLRESLRRAAREAKRVLREILRYPSAVIGLSIITLMVGGSIYTVIAYPYTEIGRHYYTEAVTGKVYVPRNAPPEWTNWFRKHDLPTTIRLNSEDGSIEKTVQTLPDDIHNILFNLSFEYPYQEFPQDVLLYIEPRYREKLPFITLRWHTPDGRLIEPQSTTATSGTIYKFSDRLNVRRELEQNPVWKNWFVTKDPGATDVFTLLFADPNAAEPVAVPGVYQLEVSAMAFEPDTEIEIEFVLLGRVFGLAGTDSLRRDLLVPLLWGMPFALAFGLSGAVITTLVAMFLAAAGVWKGGWLDNLIQRLTEANMILPVLAVGILLFALYGVNLFLIMGGVILLNIFGSPTKSFRAAFLQVKEAPYVEAAKAYGASDARIILRYLIPRIFPVVIPQLVILIPGFVALEATLGIFNVFDPRYPTWGKVIYEALSKRAWWGGSQYWVLEPIGLLLLVGIGFALLGFALERILNPRLQEKG